jgi:hypothetical protein
MAAENSSKVCEAHPMTGGDGPYSYAKNSTLQVCSYQAFANVYFTAVIAL